MRYRNTFVDRESLDVAARYEALFYGPRTADAVGRVIERHKIIMRAREEAIPRFGAIVRALRMTGLDRGQCMYLARALDPELYLTVMPWGWLRREGFDEIYSAAIEDTQEYDSPESDWEPCPTPVDAWKRYGRNEAA